MSKNEIIFEHYTDNAEIYADKLDDVRSQLQVWLNQKWYDNYLIVHCDDGDYKFEYNLNREPINSFTPKK